MLHTGVLCLRIKKAQQLINEMRKAHQIPESSINEPKDFTDVRNQVSQTILDFRRASEERNLQQSFQ